MLSKKIDALDTWCLRRKEIWSNTTPLSHKDVVLLQIFFWFRCTWSVQCTVHDGMVGTTIGKKKQSFTDLDFADDVVLLAEMLYLCLS